MNVFVTENGLDNIVQLDGSIRAGIGEVLRKEVLANIEQGRVIFECTQVKLVDSTGIGEWVRFIGDLVARCEVVYRNVPVSVIDSFNLVPDMIGSEDVANKHTVQSFFAPYYCKSCNTYVDLLLKVDDVLPKKQLPVKRCAACGQNNVPEVLGEDYLTFLER